MTPEEIFAVLPLDMAFAVLAANLVWEDTDIPIDIYFQCQRMIEANTNLEILMGLPK